MPRTASPLGGPPELQDAIKDYFSYNVLPTCGVYRLLSLAHRGHGDYTWGFRIYRTAYRAGSDADFARAIEILNDWIRHECFSYAGDDRVTEAPPLPPVSSKANEQLWQRLKHEIIEDKQLLEGASTDKLLRLHQDWVHLDRQARTRDNPSYRFFLVIDDEVMAHLLQLNISERSSRLSLAAAYSVKVYDARHDSPPEFPGGESESDSEDECDDNELPHDPMSSFEGWFWASASKLTYLWFCDYQSDEELVTIDHSWCGIERFVHCTTAIDKLPIPASRQ